MNENENENLNLIVDMLLSIESKVNALISHEIHTDDLKDFNDEIQRQRVLLIKRRIKVHPEASVKLSDGISHK